MGINYPKPQELRQRTNKNIAAATLPDVPSDLPAPPLPSFRKLEEWHELTRAFWADLWSAPMSHEYHASDINGLYVLAELHHNFWTNPNPNTAAEFRRAAVGWGLSPLDRRRLEWRIEKGAGATKPVRPTPAVAPVAPVGPLGGALEDDPRRVLQMPEKASA